MLVKGASSFRMIWLLIQAVTSMRFGTMWINFNPLMYKTNQFVEDTMRPYVELVIRKRRNRYALWKSKWGSRRTALQYSTNLPPTQVCQKPIIVYNLHCTNISSQGWDQHIFVKFVVFWRKGPCSITIIIRYRKYFSDYNYVQINQESCVRVKI